jgi:sugar phosphate isomerase/epimerase
MILKNGFSIQLYTLEEETENDFAAVLRKVAEIGYKGVEFAGYGDVPAERMKALLDENGLTPVSSHVHLSRLAEAMEEELAYNKTIGTQYIVAPYYTPENESDIRGLAEMLRRFSPMVKGAGFGFAYHNHDREFIVENGRYLLDTLLETVPPEELDLELDIYWAAYAGVDYRSYLWENAERIKLLHFKQMADFETKRGADLGDGVIDFGELVEIGDRIGVEHYILEQEEFDISPLVSVKKGFDYIDSLGVL